MAVPRLIRLSFLTAVLALAVFASPAVGDARAASGIGALRICTSCASAGGDLSRFQYVILNSSDWPMIPKLKAANPGLKALVYKNLTFSVDYGCSNGTDSAYLSTGVGYCDAQSSHSDWFLLDSQGKRVSSANYPSHWAMDVGNNAYQAKWLDNVGADLSSHGWDGVFVDDTNASMDWHLAGRTLARYPTDASWRSATRSMLARVGPGLTSRGYLVVPNLSAPWKADYDAQALWKDWLQFTSGAAQEYYSKWGSGSSGWLTGSDWTYRQEFQAITQQAGKIFLGITYAPKTDTRSMEYARASFLLYAAGGAGALLFEPTDPEAQDPYASGWTADIGSPVGPRYQVGSAWRRDYSGGAVVVNPTSSAVTVPLGGAYSLRDGTSVTVLALGPTSGAVLTGAVHSPVAPPAPPPPPPVASTPPAKASSSPVALRVKPRHHAVGLAWTGMKAARTTIFRNGNLIKIVRNLGSYRDRLRRSGPRTLTYRVCAAGTSTCSASVSIKRRHRVVARPARGAILLRLVIPFA